ncbi:MAG: hypothetical protein ACRDZQ_16670 [Acidimicrobiales bacterium]
MEVTRTVPTPATLAVRKVTASRVPPTALAPAERVAVFALAGRGDTALAFAAAAVAGLGVDPMALPQAAARRPPPTTATPMSAGLVSVGLVSVSLRVLTSLGSRGIGAGEWLLRWSVMACTSLGSVRFYGRRDHWD